MKDTTHTLITDYLTALQVPHTEDYTLKRYKTMPFHTMFGLTKLLEEYGVTSEGWKLNDKTELQKITPPFLAHTGRGFVIVTSVTPESIGYITQGVPESIVAKEFYDAFDGNVIVSQAADDAKEPDYAVHARLEFLIRAKKWVLVACAVGFLVWMYVANGLWRDVSTTLLTLVDLAGLYLTYLLVQKSMNIKNKAADRVCSVLQAGGCDDILSLKASKFFGLFGWSEVGFAYFSVSLLALLLLPQTLPALAFCNLCCLPFTCWSIWYQKFRAKKWCTLCVCVQLSLWVLFFCYLGGGWVKAAFPLSIDILPLGMAYAGVMLAINALMPRLAPDTP